MFMNVASLYRETTDKWAVKRGVPSVLTLEIYIFNCKFLEETFYSYIIYPIMYF